MRSLEEELVEAPEGEEGDSAFIKDFGLVRDDLLEEDLILRKKLDDLESAHKKIRKEIKPTLHTMSQELKAVSAEVKADKKEVEALFDKVRETRRAFSITCQALAEHLGLSLDDPYFVDFVKETSEEIQEIDNDIQNMRENKILDTTTNKSKAEQSEHSKTISYA